MNRLLDYWPGLFTPVQMQNQSSSEDGDDAVAMRASQLDDKYKNEQLTRVISLNS